MLVSRPSPWILLAFGLAVSLGAGACTPKRATPAGQDNGGAGAATTALAVAAPTDDASAPLPQEPTPPTTEPTMQPSSHDDPPPPGASPLEQRAKADAARRLGAAPDAVEMVLVAFEDGLRGYYVTPKDAGHYARGEGVLTADGEILATFEQFASTRYRKDPRATAIAVLLLVQREPKLPLAGSETRGARDPAFEADGSLVYTFHDRFRRDRLTHARVRFGPDGGVAGVDRTPP